MYMTEIRRSDVVGSLLRPGFLTEAYAGRTAGGLALAAFKELEDRAVDAAIALQEACGFEVLTDGEMRRQVFLEQFVSGINGTGAVAAPPVPLRDAQGNVENFVSPLSIVERISYKRSVSTEEYTYARARARREVKVAVPSPFLLWVMWSPTHSAAAYPDPFELFVDAAKIIRAEVLELASLGCRHIQIDAPEILQIHVDPAMRKMFGDLGLPVDRIMSEGVD